MRKNSVAHASGTIRASFATRATAGYNPGNSATRVDARIPSVSDPVTDFASTKVPGMTNDASKTENSLSIKTASRNEKTLEASPKIGAARR